jgi:hypothetical protein
MSLLSFLFTVWVACLCCTTPTTAGSLADIDHVILFMQENRAFDHVNHACQTLSKNLYMFSTLEPWPACEDFRTLM